MTPPGPRALPGLGHLPWFLGDKPAYLHRCAERYGSVVRLQLGGVTYLVTDPRDVAYVLRDNAANYSKSERISGRRGLRLWGRSLLSLEGDEHRRQRISVGPLFETEAVQEALEVWREVVTEVVSSWRDDQELQLGPTMGRLARKGVVAILFGDRMERPELEEALEARRRWLEHSLLKMGREPDPSETLRLAFRRPWPGGWLARMERQGLGEDERVSLSVAAFETGQQLLTWAAWWMAVEPAWQETGVALSRVVQEALRLTPPTWLSVRVAQGADCLPSGYGVPAGTRLYLSQFVTHRRSDLWPDPLELRMDRPLPEPGNCRFFAFGAGPRRCPAEKLARAQAEICLDCLRQTFRWSTEGPTRPTLRGAMTLEPGEDLWIRLRSRTAPARRKACEPPLFSVVVPTYGRPEAAADMLRALLGQSLPPERFEVVLVDDGSTTDYAPALAPFGERLRLRYVRLERNQGPAPARQIAIDRAQGTYLAFLDDDCLPEPDWLEQLLRGLEECPGAAVGGTTINGLPHNPYAEASQRLIDELYRHYNAHPHQASFFTTNNLAIPRLPLQALGGMRRDWELSGGEDRELCRRWTASHPLHWRSAARVRHRHALTWSSFLRQHFGYGRGARRFAGEGGRLAGRRAGFVASAVLRPWMRDPSPTGAVLTLLTAVAQAATCLGYLYESWQ